jgi:antitoxin component YwqK of YwqJK toxin-antitoxin module
MSYYDAERTKLALRSEYQQGLIQGIFEKFDRSGNLEHRHNFVDGKMEGRSETFYSSGRIHNVSSYKGGKKEGEYIGYYENFDMKRVVCLYKDDKLEGEYTAYYEDGEIELRYHYKSGILDGELVRYSPKGNIISSKFYRYGEEITSPKKDIGISTTIEVTAQVEVQIGDKTVVYYVLIDKEGKFTDIKHGLCTKYYDVEKTKLASQVRYIQGLREGKQEKWFEDQVLKVKCNYVKGELEGEYERFYSNGDKTYLLRYKDGKLEGKCIRYIDNNAVISYYRNGERLSDVPVGETLEAAKLRLIGKIYSCTSIETLNKIDTLI